MSQYILIEWQKSLDNTPEEEIYIYKMSGEVSGEVSGSATKEALW